MKHFIYLLLLIGSTTVAQEKHLTKTGKITFEASVPSFEEVKATNDAVTAIINTETGEFASLALVNGFRFKNALMEEHFNENYAESNEFPKATFRGRVNNYNTSKETQHTIDGELTFHGVTQSLKGIPVKLKQKEHIIHMSGAFSVLATEFGIKIPKIVQNKLSDKVNVHFNFELHKK